MATLLDIVKKDSTNRSVTLRIIDSTDGTPETGVVWNTAGIDLWYRREGAAKVAVTEATLAALTTAHADGGFLHISDGEYRFDLPDAAFATGAQHVDVGGTVTGMVVIGGRVRLVDYDPENAADLGLTNLTGHTPQTGDSFARIGAAGAGLTGITGAALSATGLDAIGQAATGMVEIAKAVWDRVLTGATHNIANSAGRRLRQIEASFVVASGTAQAGAAGTITLAAGESATNDIFAGDRCVIVGGTGAGEHGMITAYNGTTKVATMSQNWVITPDATSEYELVPADVDVETWNHAVVTKSATTNLPEVDATSLSDDATAADNAESFFDGTGYAGTNNVIPTVTTNTDMRGTDNAALASVCTEARLAELAAANLPTDIAAIKTIVDAIDTLTKAAGTGDLAAMKVILDKFVFTSAGRVDSNAEAINNNTAAAAAQKRAALLNLTGTASGTPTTTTMVSNIGVTVDDQYKGRTITFAADTTTAALRNQSTDITGCTASTNTLTFTALTTAPVSGDTFEIV